MFLVIINTHSKWIEAIPLPAATYQWTIQQLQTTFTHFSISDTIVTDNGTCFVSSEFEQFLSQNGIQHRRSAPYPASNGLAERGVQILKQGLKKMKDGPIEERLAKVLFNYRITPQSTTRTSPAQLLFIRNLKSHLDLIKPDISRRVEFKQQMQKSAHDSRTRSRHFIEGEEVFAHNFRHDPPWVAGKIIKSTGPSLFKITLKDGRVIRRYQNHIQKCQIPAISSTTIPHDGFNDTLDLDLSDMSNGNTSVIVPRRNPP